MTAARDIIVEALDVLQDPDAVRWSVAEMVRHLNRAQLDLMVARPDTTAAVVEYSLKPGSRQVLPASAHALIDVPRNARPPRRAITKVDARVLDAVARDWQGVTPKDTVVHFAHEMTNPRVFYVYPPAASARVELEVSEFPQDVPVPAGPAVTDITGNISVTAQWSTALLSQVLHYAYAKDAEYGGNAALAAAYAQKASTLLGTQLTATASVAPKT